MASSDSLQYPYLDTLYLNTSEHLKIYKNSITGLSERDRYDLTSSKCTYFYQDLEDFVAKFGFNAEVKVVTEKYSGNIPTEFKNIIHTYTSITRYMIYCHCRNLWANNSGAGLGRLPTAYYGSAPDDAEK